MRISTYVFIADTTARKKAMSAPWA